MSRLASPFLRGIDALGAGLFGRAHHAADAALETEPIEMDGRAVRISHHPARGAAPTVLCLHGYPDTLQVFARLGRALASEHGFVALDFPGQGRSEYAEVYAPDARARWLVRVMDHLEIGRARVFAHDMGVHAALELGLLAPGRVESMVLSHALLDGAAPTSPEIAALRRSKAYRALLPGFPKSVVARSVATFLPRETPLSESVHADLAGAFDREAGRVTARVCDEAETWLAHGLARFASISCPVKLLWGTREAHFPRAHAESLMRVIPRAELIEIAGGWHWLAWQHADAVAHALL